MSDSRATGWCLESCGRKLWFYNRPGGKIDPSFVFLNGCGVLLDLRAVKECCSKRKGNNGAHEQSTPNSRFILVMLIMQITLVGSTGGGDLPGSLLIQVASGYRTGQVPLSLQI